MTQSMKSNEKPIIAKNLVRHFGDTVAVNDLSFTVAPSEVYGLLGPNGAGKTTSVRMICGLLECTSGTVEVFGYNPMTHPIEVKQRIGLVPEDHILYESLTPREFFDFITSVRRLEQHEVKTRIQTFVEAFELEEYYDKPIATLSHGTRQKVSVISALIHSPPLLVLDEPFSGLDARSARVFKDILNLHLADGGAILFSSHILEIAEVLCTRIGIINEGQLVAEGTVKELRTKLKSEGTLEELFLRATAQDTEVQETIAALRRVLQK